MDDDSRPIGYYGVTDGAEVLMEAIDPVEAARQAAAEQAARASEGKG
jgi:hypothetical protein